METEVQRGEVTCLRVLSHLGAELGLTYSLEHPPGTFPILSICFEIRQQITITFPTADHRPGSVQSALNISPRLSPTAALWGWHYNHLHFIDRETDTQRLCDLPSCIHLTHSVHLIHGMGSNAGGLAPVLLFLTTTRHSHSATNTA